MTRPQLLDADGNLYCDWRVNTTDCAQQQIFKGIWCFMLACAVVIAAEATFLALCKWLRGRFRLFERGTLLVRPQEGTALAAGLFGYSFIPICVLQIFDIPTSQTTREALFAYPNVAMWGISVFFVCAIVRALPERYWSQDVLRHSRLPAGWFFRTTIGPTCLILIYFAACTCSLGAGIARDLGNVEADIVLYTISYNMFMTIHACQVLWTAFMHWKFTQILSTLLVDSSNVGKDTARKEQVALSRAKRVFLAMLVAHLFIFIGGLLTADIFYVYQNIALSVVAFLALIGTFCVVTAANLTVETIGFVRHMLHKKKGVHMGSSSDPRSSDHNDSHQLSSSTGAHASKLASTTADESAPDSQADSYAVNLPELA